MAKIKNATFTPAAAGPLEMRLYAIDLTKREEFLTFYRTKLLPLLITVEGVDTANLSLIESRSSLQVVFVATLNSPPWDTRLNPIFADFDKFLVETNPLVV